MRIVGINILPDDMQIACGGTLAKYVQRGHDVTVVNLAQGGYLSDGRIVRHDDQVKACELLGITPVFFRLHPRRVLVIQDAQTLLKRDGVLHDGMLVWETLTPDERALCRRAADIILNHRKRADDRHARMH